MTASVAQPTPPDETAIADGHGLVRHVSRKVCPPVPLDGGGYRLPSSAFALRKKEGKTELYLSVDLEELLRRDSLPSTHYVPADTHYAARVTAGAARAECLGVRHEPVEPTNPHHGGIWGLEPLANGPREKIQKRLALGATLINPVGSSPS